MLVAHRTVDYITKDGDDRIAASYLDSPEAVRTLEEAWPWGRRRALAMVYSGMSKATNADLPPLPPSDADEETAAVMTAAHNRAVKEKKKSLKNHFINIMTNTNTPYRDSIFGFT